MVAGRFKSDLAGNSKFALVILDAKEPKTFSFLLVTRGLIVNIEVFAVVGVDVGICQAKR